jgi:hypothetical protein
MPQSTLTYVLSTIMATIPNEILQLAFEPRKHNSTLEQRIIATVIGPQVLLDTNLVGGKRRDIYIQSGWKMNIPEAIGPDLYGMGAQSAFYLVPAEAREGRNISAVLGMSAGSAINLNGYGAAVNGVGMNGNTAMGMMSDVLNSRTFANVAPQPKVTLEGTNIIRVTPEQWLEGYPVSILLEFDLEFINMNRSAIMAMRNLCLCAVQRYIGTKLRVQIDETEVVAGSEIGVIKDIVIDYIQKGEQYNELLDKVMGAQTFDTSSLSELIRFAL